MTLLGNSQETTFEAKAKAEAEERRILPQVVEMLFKTFIVKLTMDSIHNPNNLREVAETNGKPQILF